MNFCAFISLSGGQGKTAAAFFTALLLANQGKKVLVIDADPQANLTFYLGQEVEENEPSLLEVLTGQVSTEDGIYPTRYPNLFVIPADFPSIKESEQFKKGIRQGKTLSELGHPELEYHFTKIIEVLTRD